MLFFHITVSIFLNKQKTHNDVSNEYKKKYVMKTAKKYNLTDSDVDRIIEMAWEDRTPFDAIKMQFGVPEKDVIQLMREAMKLSSWKMWRKRVQGRATKHLKKRDFSEGRHKCSRQRSISNNKIAKRR